MGCLQSVLHHTNIVTHCLLNVGHVLLFLLWVLLLFVVVVVVCVTGGCCFVLCFVGLGGGVCVCGYYSCFLLFLFFLLLFFTFPTIYIFLYCRVMLLIFSTAFET